MIEMKIFVPTHDAVIEGCYEARGEKMTDGDIVPHKPIANTAHFFMPHSVGEQHVFLKVVLSKRMILDLADKIRELESQSVDMPYEDIPF